MEPADKPKERAGYELNEFGIPIVDAEIGKRLFSDEPPNHPETNRPRESANPNWIDFSRWPF